MRLVAGAPELVASPDLAGESRVALAVPGRVIFYVGEKKAAAFEFGEGEADIAFLDDHLLCVVRGDHTHVFALTLPELDVAAELELEERMRLLTAVGARALVTNESLEHPRIVTAARALVVEPIALHQPLIFAAAAPENRLLVASRGRDQQLECWDPMYRRALFRLNLPLMQNAQLAGFAARRRLLWIASSGEQSMLELYRFSDGRLQARAELGGHLAGAAGHPESPRLVVAVQPKDGGLELAALDFAVGERHELTTPGRPISMCVVEGATPALVLHDGVQLDPIFVPLPRALPPDVDLPPPPVMTRTTKSASDVGGFARESAPRKSAQPPRAVMKDAPPDTANATQDATANAPNVATMPSRAGTWRDRLCAWCEVVLAGERNLPPPDSDDASPLADAVERLSLDARATRALGIVYAARLLGERDLPAATLARALSSSPVEADWQEALGGGALSRLGLLRAREGRVALSPTAARFLDGGAPAIAIVAAGDGALQPPAGAALLDAGDATLDDAAAALAQRVGLPVALVHLPPRADDAARRRVARALLEARLHGALPLLAGADPAAFVDPASRASSVILVRGAPPPSLAELPRI
jgi:hypothetical protein